MFSLLPYGLRHIVAKYFSQTAFISLISMLVIVSDFFRYKYELQIK